VTGRDCDETVLAESANQRRMRRYRLAGKFVSRARDFICRLDGDAPLENIMPADPVETAPKTMQIWVDADACPNVVKQILFHAAERWQVNIILVANRLLSTPPSRYVKAVQVPAGFDVADNEIVRRLQPGDLVITGDIPLASDVLQKDGHALNPRGSFYTNDNIREYMSMRQFMDELRSSGVETGGPAAFSNADRQAFANQLDKFLMKAL